MGIPKKIIFTTNIEQILNEYRQNKHRKLQSIF